MESEETRNIGVQSVIETIIATVCLGNESSESRRYRMDDDDVKLLFGNQEEENITSSINRCEVNIRFNDVQEEDDTKSIEKSQRTIKTLLESLPNNEDDDDDDDFLQSSINSSHSQSTFDSIFENSFKRPRRFCSHDTLVGSLSPENARNKLQRRRTSEATKTISLESHHSNLMCYKTGTFPRKEHRVINRFNSTKCIEAKKSSSLTSMHTLFKDFSIERVNLTSPNDIKEISIDLLQSGIATTPGSRDVKGRRILMIRIDEIAWQKCKVERSNLAQYLLYLTCRCSSSYLVLIDARSSGVTSSIDTAIEALALLQEHGKPDCNYFEVLFLTEDNITVDNLKSYIEGRLRTKCDIIKSMEELEKYVSKVELPIQFGGSRKFSQAEWIQGRLVVDSYVVFCEDICQKFQQKTASISSQSTPSSVRDTKRLLTQLRADFQRMNDDIELRNIRSRRQRVLEQLALCDSYDNEINANYIQAKFDKAGQAVATFTKTTNERLIALERHLLVMKFEQSCDYISRWYNDSFPIIEEKFSKPADSLDVLRTQTKDFDLYYIQVTKQYSKCKGLLSQAIEFKQLGYIPEGELLKRAQLIDEQISRLKFVMDGRKREIEVASEMYRFIDQAYAWALNGMKFVMLLKVDECISIEKCQEMINKFDNYMEQHPAINEEAFEEIFTLGRNYGNNKCLQQIEYAEQKCKETLEFFKKRRQLLLKAKSQLKAKKRSATSFKIRSRNSLDSKSKINGDSIVHVVSSPQSPTFLDDSHRRRISVQSIESKNSSTSDDASSSGDPTTLLKHSSPTPLNISDTVTKTVDDVTATEMSSSVSESSPLSPNTPPERANTSKLKLIIDELISTEQDYVKSLNYVIKHYVPEMSRLDLPHALRCKRNIIFGNIEKIAEFHTNQFLHELEHCRDKPQFVAHTFQLHKKNFSLYALYSKNKPQSDQLLTEHGNEFFRTKQLKLGDKMNLASYLLKPVQRMAKYALLLHNMSKRTTGNVEKCLKDAESLVKFQLRHGNDLLTMDSIRGCDVNLKEQGNLLRQEQFIINSGHKKMQRRVFLFEDLILFAKPVKVSGSHDAYQYKCSYKTAEIGMTENIGESGNKFEIWFRRRKSHQTSQPTFVLQATSRSVKRQWVDEIRSLLWKQALRNKG